jgi:hypothetical protein
MTSGGGSWRCRAGSSSPPALFLFFISEDDKLDLEKLDEHDKKRARFVAKLKYEVRATTKALALLERRLKEIGGWTSAHGS